MAFDTVLVANRGEIAVRILRSLRALGLRGVAVYTAADRDAPHVALADEALCIGEGPAEDSYLSAERLLAAARRSGAGAIHPGYGFLSENAAFAEAVAAAGLVFVGPPPEAIRLMGDKAEARRRMRAAGVPCVPGYDGDDQSDATLAAEARRIGWPVMVKAAAGGGGRGMRLVRSPADLAGALALARAEAGRAFGSERLILERAVENARHVEFQIFADAAGNVIHLGERDCSVQRRHQKVIEEAPCPAMTPALRARMGAAAVTAARAVGYRGAGTVEFLLDDGGGHYFLEMNTRLQVEHPVTEMVTGLDLVEMQIRVARGEALELDQEAVRLRGHAIEARLYAEDAGNGFLPATGRVGLWRPARGAGVRIDAGIAAGQEITPFYDPLLAKIVAHGPTRAIALDRLRRAVAETVVLGCTTNAPFLAAVLARPEFAAGQATTGFLDAAFPDGFAAPAPEPADIALAAALLMQAAREAARARAGFVADEQLNWSSAPLPLRPETLETPGGPVSLQVGARDGGWLVRFGPAGGEGGGEDGAEAAETVETAEAFHVAALRVAADGTVEARIGDRRVRALARVAGDVVELAVGARRMLFRRRAAGPADAAAEGEGTVRAPMPGVVRSVSVAPGETVRRGDPLAVLEAMKMQHRIVAPCDGTVLRVAAEAGAQVAAGAVLIEIGEA